MVRQNSLIQASPGFASVINTVHSRSRIMFAMPISRKARNALELLVFSALCSIKCLRIIRRKNSADSRKSTLYAIMLRLLCPASRGG